MPRRRLSRSRHTGFTLIELMIVILILSILAAIAIPRVGQYISQTNQAAAESSLDGAQKAVDVYHAQNGAWPASLTPDLFRSGDPLKLPSGYSLQYDNLTGVVTLVIGALFLK